MYVCIYIYIYVLVNIILERAAAGLALRHAEPRVMRLDSSNQGV